MTDELARLRGELVLWKARARLNDQERRIMRNAIRRLDAIGHGMQLRWVYQRRTKKVSE
jgi:hypothetical protein